MRNSGSPAHPKTGYRGFSLIEMLIAIGITLYFWRVNIIGIPESSAKALRIMQLTTVMGILVIGWASVTLMLHPALRHLPNGAGHP